MSTPMPLTYHSKMRANESAFPSEEFQNSGINSIAGSVQSRNSCSSTPELWNRAALREREYLAAKLEAQVDVAPPPLHDFSHDDNDADHRFLSRSGVPGRRMLRLRPEMKPQHTLACENEPEGPQMNPDDIEKVLEEREGLLVYRRNFQDLPPGTPALVTHRLDMMDGSNGHENLTALRPFYTPESQEDIVLVFESRFESGNLYSALQVAPFEYDLKLSNDTGTSGHTQWFYFSVGNTRKGIPYTFNITNMLKSDSLYNHGLRPILYSISKSRGQSIGWHRAGQGILYYPNQIHAEKKKGKFCHTLTFTVTFPHDYDTCYLSHCYPYTYGDLQVYLEQLELSPESRSFIRRTRLCETEAGNRCDVLTITCRSADEDENRRKKGIVISARVHPGETNASYMMKGCIDFLLSDAPEALQLRRNFVFKIVPMLCPDGVVNGNYRCCIAGHDMNRRWANPKPREHSPIYHCKLMMKEFTKERDVVLFCDFHGHSRKKNVFLYGCDARYWKTEEGKIKSESGKGKVHSGGDSAYSAAPVAFSERVFPMLLQARLDSFALSCCRFKVQKSKASTGRVVCWRQLRIHNSYTVEASFCGPDSGPKSNMHFDLRELEQMGRAICLSILDQFGGDGMYQQRLMQQATEVMEVAEGEDASSDSDDSSSDEEIVEMKTPSKSKTLKMRPVAERNAAAERPKSTTETPEKELEMAELAALPPTRARIHPRHKSARLSRLNSHLRPTLSARARTAEPRASYHGSAADIFAGNACRISYDNTCRIAYAPPHRRFSEPACHTGAQGLGLDWKSSTGEKGEKDAYASVSEQAQVIIGAHTPKDLHATGVVLDSKSVLDNEGSSSRASAQAEEAKDPRREAENSSLQTPLGIRYSYDEKTEAISPLQRRSEKSRSGGVWRPHRRSSWQTDGSSPLQEENFGRGIRGGAFNAFQHFQDLQRIAEKTRVQATKTVHTLLFTADIPEECIVLRRPTPLRPTSLPTAPTAKPPICPSSYPPCSYLHETASPLQVRPRSRTSTSPVRSLQKPNLAEISSDFDALLGRTGARGVQQRTLHTPTGSLHTPQQRPATAHIFGRGRAKIHESCSGGRISPDLPAASLHADFVSVTGMDVAEASVFQPGSSSNAHTDGERQKGAESEGEAESEGDRQVAAALTFRLPLNPAAGVGGRGGGEKHVNMYTASHADALAHTSAVLDTASPFLQPSTQTHTHWNMELKCDVKNLAGKLQPALSSGMVENKRSKADNKRSCSSKPDNKRRYAGEQAQQNEGKEKDRRLASRNPSSSLPRDFVVSASRPKRYLALPQ